MAVGIAIIAVGWLGASELPQERGAPKEGRMKKTTTKNTARKFVRGPSVTPNDKLVAWFERQILEGGARQFRVPLVLRQGQVGFSLRGARIGAAADAIEVYANDSALGIGLADRAATHCKGRRTCAFWVEGSLVREATGEFRFDVIRVSSSIEPDAIASANYVEVEERIERTIPEPAEPEQGFPIPRGARRNDSLGGATSLAPGRNYTLRVYDVDCDMETATAFYERYLPESKRASEGQEVKFATPRGYVKLSRSAHGTRITLAVGPQ